MNMRLIYQKKLNSNKFELEKVYEKKYIYVILN